MPDKVLYDLLEVRIRSSGTIVAGAPGRMAGESRMFSSPIMLNMSI